MTSRPCRQFTDTQKVGEPFVDPTLGDPKTTAAEPEQGRCQVVALDLSIERRKRRLGRVQLALLDQCVHEDATVEYSV